MPTPDAHEEVDDRIAGAIERAVQRVREELLDRLRDTHSQIEGIAREIGLDSASAAQESAAPTESTTTLLVTRLHEALSGFDRAKTQGEILKTLLSRTSDFCSRVALLLTRPEGAKGWGSIGFGEQGKNFQNLTIPYDGVGGWSRLAAGKGCVRLNPSDCAALCERLGSPMPSQGFLIPLVLRDRVAAALYVDGTEGDPDPDLLALQLLTFVAALALETMPLRGRAATPTLRLADEVPAEDPGLQLWTTLAPAEREALAAPAPPTEESTTGPAALPETPPADEPAPDLAVETIPPLEPAVESLVVEEPTAAPEVPPLEETPTEPQFEESIPDGALVDIEPDTELPAPIEAPTPIPPVEVLDDTPAQMETDLATGPSPLTTLEPEAPPEPPPVSEPISEPEATSTAAVSAADDSTAEIAPPENLDGPGWAFSAEDAATASPGDTAKEEARRLARLLVTEIKLYNEEQVEEGRRQGDLMSRLREDIERSRNIFDERVEESVRRDKDFFQEELVRILGGGDPNAL